MKVFSNIWFNLLCWLLLVKPVCISSMPSLGLLDNLINILRIVIVLFIFYTFCLSIKKIRKGKLLSTTIIIIFTIIVEIAITYYKAGYINDWGGILNNFGMALFCFISIYNNYKVFVKSASIILGTYVVVNTMSIFIFPSGMFATTQYTDNFFLGYRTAWFAIYMTAMFTSLLWYSHEKTFNIKVWLCIVVFNSYLSMIMVWTATGLFCFTLAAVLLVISKKNNSYGLRIIPLLISEGVIFYLIIIARIGDRFSFFLVDILKKDVTFSARTRIWDNSLSIISNNFWFGIGKLDPVIMKELLGFGVTHSHCRYLFYMVCYGFLGLSLFIFLIYFAFSGNVSKEGYSERRIIMSSLVALLTAFQVESFSTGNGYLFPLILIAAANYDKFKLESKPFRLILQ